MTERITNFETSMALNERLHRVVPAGSHTYSKGEDQFPRRGPKIIARAKGAFCWDVDGNRYIDWAMGNRVMILGHAYPAVNQAVARAIEDGVNFSRPGILELELAEYLVDLLPVAEMVKFGKNGSDVTSAAVRLARAYTGRDLVARCADHPFFSINDWFIGTTAMNAGIPDEVSALTVSFPYNDLEGTKALFDKHQGEIAALILEPVKNEPPAEGYLQGLKDLASERGAVLIFDEMISGMRFDIRGAHHRWGVYPDLACFGKAVANGYSFSFLAGKREIMERGGLRHEHPRVFLLSQTHGSETVGLAACRATMDECRRVDIAAHTWGLGKRLKDGANEIFKREGVAERLRMSGFDCNPFIECLDEQGRHQPALNACLHEELIARGVLIPWISITWSHQDEELQHTLEALGHAAAKVRRALESNAVEESFEGPAPLPVFRPWNDPGHP